MRQKNIFFHFKNSTDTPKATADHTWRPRPNQCWAKIAGCISTLFFSADAKIINLFHNSKYYLVKF